MYATPIMNVNYLCKFNVSPVDEYSSTHEKAQLEYNFFYSFQPYCVTSSAFKQQRLEQSHSCLFHTIFSIDKNVSLMSYCEPPIRPACTARDYL